MLTDPSPVDLRWLEGGQLGESPGVTWGIPWPRGFMRADGAFALETGDGKPVPVQSRPLAFWPDGSLKWSAHSIGRAGKDGDGFRLRAGTPPASGAESPAVTTRDEADRVLVDTGAIRCEIAKSGSALIRSIERNGSTAIRDLALVCLRQDGPGTELRSGTLRVFRSEGKIERAVVEADGPELAVIRIEGAHVEESGRSWLPFTVRLYFHSGAEAVRIVHSFVFDGDENADFIRGIGLRFITPLSDPLHDRHVRFCGAGKGLWAEAVRNLTGLRRDPGRAFTEAQLAGRACPPVSEFPETVGKRLDLVPAFGDITLFQSSADSFAIRKRTGEGYSWLEAATGGRAAGTGYLGGPSGGAAFGIRDFWQKHPAQIDVRGATGPEASIHLWLRSPDAPPMDLRSYHDGLGMDTYEKQLEGLEITYEDYEPGFATPYGIARTSELFVWALSATPTRERTVAIADAVRSPALLVCRPERYAAIPVFGGLWSLPDRSTPERAGIEDSLDWLFDYYRQEVDRRSWYGFLDYGDFMHTYDADRHVWRYDVGGFAWDNSELATDLWLWYAFLRTGRADILRTAEAMTRHTGEVDAYHAGRFRGLGSRHNVKHWGCSAKQVRISSSLYRRVYYFLTADERTGDLMRETVDADARLLDVVPLRKYAHAWPPAWKENHPTMVSVGTDWCTFAANWLAEWERTGNAEYGEKIRRGMESIGRMPYGFFSADPAGYDPRTGELALREGGTVTVSHLQAVFGAVELCAELAVLVDEPGFDRAWLSYCELYGADPAVQERELGRSLSANILSVAHSRLTAYAAMRKGDAALARRAWKEFFEGDRRSGWYPRIVERCATRIEGPVVLETIDEAAWVSTNAAVQWCLAAIQNLALVGDYLPRA
jgi:hypothetical protein